MSADNRRETEELQTGLLMLFRQYTRGCITCLGTVTNVDPVKYTCTVNTLNGTYTGVPLSVLKGVQGGDVKLPVDGSYCLITFKNNDTNLPQFLFANEVDKWYFTANKSYLNGEYYFNNGTVGIPVTNDLVTRLNDLENQVNDILNVLKTTVIPLAPSGTYPFAPLYSSINDLVPTVAGDIESTKVFNDT